MGNLNRKNPIQKAPRPQGVSQRDPGADGRKRWGDEVSVYSLNRWVRRRTSTGAGRVEDGSRASAKRPAPGSTSATAGGGRSCRPVAGQIRGSQTKGTCRTSEKESGGSRATTSRRRPPW